jgi:hypothetical protein
MDASASAFVIHLRQGFGRLAASADGDPLVHFVPAAGGASASSAARAHPKAAIGAVTRWRKRCYSGR